MRPKKAALNVDRRVKIKVFFPGRTVADLFFFFFFESEIASCVPYPALVKEEDAAARPFTKKCTFKKILEHLFLILLLCLGNGY